MDNVEKTQNVNTPSLQSKGDLQAPGLDGGWQPIETAPKDGTHILAFEPVGGDGQPTFAVVWWWSSQHTSYEKIEGTETFRAVVQECYSGWEGAGYSPFLATHWMPLPSPPSSPERSPAEASSISKRELSDILSRTDANDMAALSSRLATLTAQRDEAIEALKPFAGQADFYVGQPDSTFVRARAANSGATASEFCTVADLRRARALVAKQEGK